MKIRAIGFLAIIAAALLCGCGLESDASFGALPDGVCGYTYSEEGIGGPLYRTTSYLFLSDSAEEYTKHSRALSKTYPVGRLEELIKNNPGQGIEAFSRAKDYANTPFGEFFLFHSIDERSRYTLFIDDARYDIPKPDGYEYSGWQLSDGNVTLFTHDSENGRICCISLDTATGVVKNAEFKVDGKIYTNHILLNDGFLYYLTHSGDESYRLVMQPSGADEPVFYEFPRRPLSFHLIEGDELLLTSCLDSRICVERISVDGEPLSESIIEFPDRAAIENLSENTNIYLYGDTLYGFRRTQSGSALFACELGSSSPHYFFELGKIQKRSGIVGYSKFMVEKDGLLFDMLPHIQNTAIFGEADDTSAQYPEPVTFLPPYVPENLNVTDDELQTIYSSLSFFSYNRPLPDFSAPAECDYIYLLTSCAFKADMLADQPGFETAIALYESKGLSREIAGTGITKESLQKAVDKYFGGAVTVDAERFSDELDRRIQSGEFNKNPVIYDTSYELFFIQPSYFSELVPCVLSYDSQSRRAVIAFVENSYGDLYTLDGRYISGSGSDTSGVEKYEGDLESYLTQQAQRYEVVFSDGEELHIISFNQASPISANSQYMAPLTLPVADVSPQYAEAAQKILDSFYFSSDDIPDYFFDMTWRELEQKLDPKLSHMPKGSESYSMLREYCYQPHGIDVYFLGHREAGAELRSGKPLPEVMALSDALADEFYGTINRAYMLYGTKAPAAIIGEAQYHLCTDDGEQVERLNSMYEWLSGPTTALFLDDRLMGMLEEEGFDLDKTAAMSVNITAHSCGVYFSDGVTERYYPQEVGEYTPLLSIGELYPIDVLAESLETISFAGMNLAGIAAYPETVELQLTHSYADISEFNDGAFPLSGKIVNNSGEQIIYSPQYSVERLNGESWEELSFSRDALPNWETGSGVIEPGEHLERGYPHWRFEQRLTAGKYRIVQWVARVPNSGEDDSESWERFALYAEFEITDVGDPYASDAEEAVISLSTEPAFWRGQTRIPLYYENHGAEPVKIRKPFKLERLEAGKWSDCTKEGEDAPDLDRPDVEAPVEPGERRKFKAGIGWIAADADDWRMPSGSYRLTIELSDGSCESVEFLLQSDVPDYGNGVTAAMQQPQYPVGQEKLMLLITNGSDEMLYSGYGYILEQRLQGEWTSAASTGDVPVIDFAFTISNGETASFSFEPEKDKYEFSAGYYRIIKQVGDLYYAAEFEIVQQ